MLTGEIENIITRLESYVRNLLSLEEDITEREELVLRVPWERSESNEEENSTCDEPGVFSRWSVIWMWKT